MTKLMDLSFNQFFTKAYGGTHRPFAFQVRLAEEAWPDVLQAPTGVGKTAAATLAWAWKRLNNDSDTPRRLVWCLPMRTLVEQTAEVCEEWMNKFSPYWEQAGRSRPDVYRLLGGEVHKDWVNDPVREAIIIGTQDMLLSRALMRGYGMSRFRWPIDFALLHTDSLWIFDEVQLMGCGLATSAQLEAFRRSDGRFLGARSKSLWMSATFDPEWLNTVDFRAQVPAPVIHHWNDKNTAQAEPPMLQKRLDARKSVQQLEDIAYKDYGQLAATIINKHCQNRPTLVIVNRVDRAQEIYKALIKAGRDSNDTPLFSSNFRPCKDNTILLHSRFRPQERLLIVEKVRNLQQNDDKIIVSTQAVEAGVDISAAVLITDLAPWSSLVQRFGRCNRKGEFGTTNDDSTAGSAIYWIDIDEKNARPYDIAELDDAREKLNAPDINASPRQLAKIEIPPMPLPLHVIRRKDFDELFDTDSDLMGFDIDISPYIRDANDTDVRLFWRNLPEGEKSLAGQPRPQRDELCPAPIGVVRGWLEKDNARKAYRFDILSKGKAQWTPLGNNPPRPGEMLMIDSTIGGYSPERGFDRTIKRAINPDVEQEQFATAHSPMDTHADDLDSQRDKAIGLADHLLHVYTAASNICADLGLATDYRNRIERAAVWHDVGKAHQQFQSRIIRKEGEPEGLLAKASQWQKTWKTENTDEKPRRFFRHELASALAFLAQHDDEADADLVAFLIAAHHGKVRMSIRALPGETAPNKENTLFARGVWDGDELPSVQVGEEISNSITLSLDIMSQGIRDGKPSWIARTQRLFAEHGPFRIALLETIVRLADWQASKEEQEETGGVAK